MVRACLKLERKMLSNVCLRRDFCDRRFSGNERFDGMFRLLLSFHDYLFVACGSPLCKKSAWRLILQAGAAMYS